MAERVTNEAVAVALRGLGFDIGQIDMSGAQNSAWKLRVLPLLRGKIPPGQFAEDVFNRAIETAKKIKDIPADANPVDRLSQTLSAYGVKGAQYTQIIEEAKRIKKADRSLRDRGTPFDVGDYAQAAANVLGHTGAVLDAFSNAGITKPPPPAPGSAGEKAAPPPGAGPAAPLLAGPVPKDAGNVTAGAKMAAPAGRPTDKAGIMALQRTLGVKADGIWGPGTQAAYQKSQGGGGPAAPRGTVTQTTPGTAPPPTDDTPALGAGASQQAVHDYVRKHYAQYAWLLDVPDVAGMMRTAAEKGWGSEEVQGAFTQTEWWKKTEPSARLWAEQKAIDPANAADQLRRKTTDFRDAAKSAGITISDADLAILAEDSLKFGWDENETRAGMGRFYNYDEKNLLGTAQTTSASLKQAAKDWLVPLDGATLGKWTEQVMRGEADLEFFNTYLQGQAASMFPQLADPISRGITPSQWMAPYRSVAAETLGVNPETINLTDPKWLRAVTQVDEKGGVTPMTLYDWKNLLKTDDTYGFDKTQAGKDHGATLARNIAAQFGYGTGGGL